MTETAGETRRHIHVVHFTYCTSLNMTLIIARKAGCRAAVKVFDRPDSRLKLALSAPPAANLSNLRYPLLPPFIGPVVTITNEKKLITFKMHDKRTEHAGPT